jgi:hypothetical protein
MNALLDRQLLFVSGKGGTGKTSVAAALAELAVQRGKRVLVCEMDAKGALAAAYDVRELTFQPTEVQPGLHAMVMNTEDSLREYLRLFVRIPLVGRIGPLARTFDFVADAAPGVKEILAIGKLCHEVRVRNYDLVVVDAEASGHIVAQIDAPRAIRELVQVGMVRDQTEWMLDILGDHDRTGLVVVATPEEMPVSETIELVDNGCSPPPTSMLLRSSPTECCRSGSPAPTRRCSRRCWSRNHSGCWPRPQAQRWPLCSRPLRWPRRGATWSCNTWIVCVQKCRPACRWCCCPSCSPALGGAAWCR